MSTVVPELRSAIGTAQEKSCFSVCVCVCVRAGWWPASLTSNCARSAS